MASGEPITGFEGVEDTLLYETLQQAERKKQQIMEMQLPGQERAAAALGNFANILVQRWAPPEAARRAAAVTTARTNASRAIRGETFASPHARRIALVEAAATDLEAQGMNAEADKLRANADAIREQQLELSILQGKDKEQTAKAEYEAATVQDRIKREVAERTKSEVDARILAGTEHAKIDEATTDAKAARVGLARDIYARDVQDRLDSESTRASTAASRTSAAASAQTSYFQRLGTMKTVRIAATGALAEGLVSPTGQISVSQPDGTFKTYSGSEAVTVEVAGDLGTYKPATTIQSKAAEKINGTFAFMNVALANRRAIIQDPSAGSAGTAMARVFNNIRADARSAVQLIGGAEATAWNDKLIESVLERAGINDTAHRARTSDMAYALASAREGGRLSISDVEQALIATGGANSDPRQRLAAQDAMVVQMMQATQQVYEQAGVPPGPLYAKTARAYADEMYRYEVRVPGYGANVMGPAANRQRNQSGQPQRAPAATRQLRGGVFVPRGN